MAQRFSTLLFAVLLLTAAACSKKHDDPEPEAALDGTWHQTYFQSIQYNPDGSLRRDNGRVPADPVFVFEFSGNTLNQARFERTQAGNVLVPMVSGTYSRTGNDLTVQYPGSTIPTDQYQITKLTSTTLVVENTVPNSIAPNTGTVKFISEFARQ